MLKPLTLGVLMVGGAGAWCRCCAGDVGLERKITYEGGYERLHVVVGHLSEMTAVKLRCGYNESDWPVRDIPVVVTAKDMPLGKLLRSIADATHVQVVAQRARSSDGKETLAYRLYRTKQGQEAITGALEARERATRELGKWAWDALASLSAVPESVLKSLPRVRYDC